MQASVASVMSIVSDAEVTQPSRYNVWFSPHMPEPPPIAAWQTAHLVLQQRIQGQKRIRDAARDGDVDLVYNWLLVHPACANRKDRSFRPAVLHLLALQS